MTTILVVGAAPAAGSDDFYRALLASADHVVAADAAGEWCVRLGRIPDLVVGDFDSAIDGACERLEALGVTVRTYPPDKDRTDLELAIEAATDVFGGAVTLTAAFSARLDHTLASIGALLAGGAGATAVEPGWTAYACHPGSELHIEAPAGTVISLLSPGGADGVSVGGLRWPLVNAHLAPLSGHGVSNEALGGPIAVNVVRGALVVFVVT